jgi:hypothetical protein
MKQTTCGLRQFCITHSRLGGGGTIYSSQPVHISLNQAELEPEVGRWLRAVKHLANYIHYLVTQRTSQVYTRFRRASKTLYIVRKLERTHLILGIGWQSVLLAFIPFIRGIESYWCVRIDTDVVASLQWGLYYLRQSLAANSILRVDFRADPSVQCWSSGVDSSSCRQDRADLLLKLQLQ